ncbi:MAG: ABC transporter permease [Chloroflexota bacterium]
MSETGEWRSIAGRHFAVLAVQYRAQLALQLHYRAMHVVWLLWFVLKPVLFLSVWSAVVRSSGGPVGWLAPEDFAAYFIAIMWVIHLTFNGAFAYFESRVRRGDFSPLLLRPVHPIVGDIAENLAYKTHTTPMLALATLVLVVTFAPRIEPPLWAVAASVPALFLAFVVRFVNTWTVALAAFWLTRTQAVVQGYLLVLHFLGGEAAPLALLPGWVQAAAWVTPFPWMLAFPAELLIGRLTPAQALAGMGMQLLWVVLSLLLAWACWRAALRRYTAVGA